MAEAKHLTTSNGRGSLVIQELKTITVVVSATLAALFVHHVIAQAEASATKHGRPALLETDQTSLVFLQ